jgi:hypothetical protein
MSPSPRQPESPRNLLQALLACPQKRARGQANRGEQVSIDVTYAQPIECVCFDEVETRITVILDDAA